MNANRHRLVFNRALGALVPAAETVRSQDKAPGTRRAITAAPLAALVGLLAMPAMADQPSGLIPHSTIQWTNAGIDQAHTNANLLTIQQTQPRAILDWQQFNLERGQGVVFNQHGNTNWSALNRIWDANPSTIAGSIRADGEVILINRNGILFKDGAQLDMQSLIASALDISNSTFNNGLLSLTLGQPAFSWGGTAEQFRTSLIQIFPGAELVSRNNGRIVVLAPNVLNQGVIRTPGGQTILAAGAKVYLSAPTDTTLRGFLVEVDPFVGNDGAGNAVNIGGRVTNDAMGQINRLGQIIADRGNVTLAALAVNQSGRVRSTTTVNLNGSIRIIGRDTTYSEDGGTRTLQTVNVNGVQVLQGKRTGEVVFGAGSLTEILPELVSKTTSQDGQAFTHSLIEIAGRNVRLGDGAAIVAPSGDVRIVAQQGLLFQNPGDPAVDGVRVYLGKGSRIDVGGVVDVGVAMERNFIDVQLRGNELRDSPLLRDSFLRGKTVTIDIRQGTTLADVSGYLNQVGRTVGERSTTGGSITVRSEGDVIARTNSVLDVSGGSIKYADGYGAATKLSGADGKTYDIGTASRDRVYVGFADKLQTVDASGRVVDQIGSVASRQQQSGYREGKSAGTIDVLGHAVVLDGKLDGATIKGPFQRDVGTLPAGGRLVIGDASAAAVGAGTFKLGDIAFVSQRQLLPATFSADTALNAAFVDRVELDAAALSRGGFSRIAAFGNGAISVERGVTVQTDPGGNVSLTGRRIDIEGSIVAPGGTIALESHLTSPLQDISRYGITVGGSGRLSTRGLWTNDIPGTSVAAGTGAIAIKGGSVRLTAVTDVELERGSVVDVSGGAQWTNAGRLRAGDAGSISISSGRFLLGDGEAQVSMLDLNGRLRGYSAAKGGALTLATSFVSIGGAATGHAGELHLAAPDFSTGGFSSYRIVGQDGIVVAPGTAVQPNPQAWIFAGDASSRPTGIDPASAVAVYRALDWQQRQPTSLALSAGSVAFGSVLLSAGSVVAVDPGGQVAIDAGLQLTVLGRIVARAGSIDLATSVPSDRAGYQPGQSIWFGAASVLDARGIGRLQPSAGGLRIGDILDGGAIHVTAERGSIITLVGSRMDVSGVADVLDVKQNAATGGFFQPTVVAASAGAISLTALDGMLLDGGLRGAPGGAGAAGGVLTIAMDRQASFLSFPSGPREIVVSQGGNFVPTGAQPGSILDAPFNGRALVAADRLRTSGFEMFDLRARNAIEFAGNVDVVAARGVRLDAPVIQASGAGAVHIDAPYVSLGSEDAARSASGTPMAGSATLRVDARQIDLTGITDLSGFGRIDLVAAGDVRLRPVIVANSVPESTAKRYTVEGRFLTGADTTITAQQLYPASFGRYTLGIRTFSDEKVRVETAATLTINRSPGTAALPLSAGADLTLEAANIVNNGVIRVPFGRLALDASKQITLAVGSITSVSGDGLLVPFGKTDLSGKDYVYDLGPAALVVTLPPEKRVVLSAPDVSMKGTVDLHGGGELYAYEFTVGPGGSKDILDPAVSPNSFAILPGLGSAYAPFDVQYSIGAGGVLPGERIRLDGLTAFGDKSRLGDGSFLVLPARYALLPGAFLVTPLSGTRDFTASAAYSPTAGSQVVAGRLEHAVAAGGATGETRDSAYLVQGGREVRRQSEYTETTASKFFASRPTAQLPGDAGALSISAGTQLVLDGVIDTVAQSGRRGAEVDIAAPNLAVVRPGSVAANGLLVIDQVTFLAIGADKLNKLNAYSLLLGGTRSRTATTIDIQAANPDSEVVIANDASAPLTGREIMLVAGRSITLAPGSIVRAEGDTRVDSAPLRIEGDGAFVRASTGSLGSLQRFNDLGAKGTLTLQPGNGTSAGATVIGTGSVMLDATKDTIVAGNSIFQAPAVSVASGRISFGAVPDATGGLVVGATLLDRLGQVRDLTLRSYSSIDFHDAVALGTVETVGTGDSATTRPFIRRLVLDAPGIGHYGAGDVTLTAGQVVVRNTTPASGASPFANAPAGAGTMSVVALARTDWTTGDVRVDGGNVLIDGFRTVAVQVAGQIVGSGTGELRATGDLSLAARRIVAESNADQRFVSDGALAVRAVGTALATLWDAVAGRLVFAADSIDVTGRIEVPGGSIALSAQHDLTLGAGAVLDASGRQKIFGSSTQTVSAGDVSLTSASGDVIIGGDARVTVRSAAAGGNAGTVDVSAAQGRFVFGGTLDGRAGTGARGGSITVDAASLDDAVAATANDFGALNSSLNAGGFDESRAVRLRTGDLVHSAGDAAVRAHHVTLATDAGSMDLGGLIDASGVKGGSIALWSGSGIMVESTARFDASGTAATATGVGSAGRGGSIVLGTSGTGEHDKLTFVVLGAAKPAFNVAGAGDGRGGTVTFRVPRLGNDVNAAAFTGTIDGASDVVVEAYKVYSASTLSTSGTTVAGGNLNLSTSGAKAGVFNETRDYIAASSQAIRDKFGSGTRVRPGIEMRSGGDLTLASDWNLCGTQATCAGPTAWRFGAAEPGVLTLRAGGDLLLNGTLSDGFNGFAANAGLQATDSWSYRIVAGADPAAANPLAVLPAASAGNGDIVLAAQRMIRTGTGSIELAARRDIQLQSVQSVIYTAGRPGPAVDGFVAPSIGQNKPQNTSSLDRGVPAAVFPDQGGDISIGAGRDIVAIKSTQFVTDWLYRDAKHTSSTALRYSNPQTSWWVRFDQFQQGIGALAGGDVTVDAGRNIENVSAVIPTNARLGGALTSTPDRTLLVEQGGGDLSVRAAGDVKGGLYYVAKGSGTIEATGAVTAGTDDTAANVFLGLGDGAFHVAGRDSVTIESVFNPTLIPQVRPNRGLTGQVFTAFSTYTETATVTLSSARGDVVFSNNDLLAGSNANAFVYPGSVTATAYSGSIAVQHTMYLYPSGKGDLNLYADLGVSVGAPILMSDASPSVLPSALAPDAAYDRINQQFVNGAERGAIFHADPVLHAADRDRVEVIARRGDIVGNSSLFGIFAKPVQFDAGGDIRDVWVIAQNLRATDISVFHAGGDFVYTTQRDPLSGARLANSAQLVLGGPGELQVQAGGSVDLGASAGLVTRGNLNNPFLPDQGAAIRVSAGGVPQGVGAFIRRYVDGRDDPLAVLGADFLEQMRILAKDDSLYLDGAIGLYRARVRFFAKAVEFAAAPGSAAKPIGSNALVARLARNAGVRYRADLLTFMRGLEGTEGFDTVTVRDRFQALAPETQTAFVNHVLFAELKAGGRGALAGTDPTYSHGYKAIGILYPGSVDAGGKGPPGAAGARKFTHDTTYAGKGDIDLFFSQIKTEQGGDVEMRVPNGLVNAGLANPGDLPKQASELGIVTVRGGTIRSFVSDDFLVNQSRVFTLQGGDILIWSSWGNIDAGKGAKTATATPPPQLIVTPDGRFVIDTSRSVSGSGIGTLLGREDVTPGDIDLIAPRGAVDAGDAGIAGSRIFIAADKVFNVGNIGGTLVTNASNAPVTITPVSVGNPVSDAQKSIEKAQQQISNRATQPNDAFKPSFLTVEVIGLGDDDSKRKDDPNRKL